jgi:hypothetical protein
MTQITSESSDRALPQLSPGYLMAPFGWAAKPLAALLEADRSLYPALFILSRQRMHLIAFALAHCSGETDAAFARLIIAGAPRAVVDAVLGHRPAGLSRALAHLPVGVLPQASYRHLIELLDQPATAKLIYHLDSVEGEYVDLLHSVPASLRRIVVATIDDRRLRPEGLVDGLRFLVARGAAPSFEALVADLAAIRQPAQFVARIRNLVQRLPLPDFIPPVKVSGSRRLDSVAEICRLAKRWKNCLADCYLDAVNDVRAAVYFWPHGETPAACVVNRHGRLGWGLADAKGPENAELPLARLQEIHCAFAAAGIPKESAIEAIEHAAHSVTTSRRARRRRRRNEMPPWELEEIYEEYGQEIEALEAA